MHICKMFKLMKWFASFISKEHRNKQKDSICDDVFLYFKFFKRFRSVPLNTNIHTGNGILRNGTEPEEIYSEERLLK